MMLHITFDSQKGEDDRDVQTAVTGKLANYMQRPVTSVCLNENLGKGFVVKVPHIDNRFKERGNPDLSWVDDPSVGEKQSTFYALFYPLSLYCPFGASNIHHAYNKANKLWGRDDINFGGYKRMAVITRMVGVSGWTQVSQTLMTKLVKAWKEEQKAERIMSNYEQ